VSRDFLALATEGVRGLRPYQPGKPVEELERELGLRDVVKLASNESPLGPSPHALAAAREQLADLARYPDGNGTMLKAAIARRIGATGRMLTLGNGSNDVLELIVRAFVSPHHDVVFSEHAFAVYALATQAVGARPVVVKARRYGHDLDAMADAVGVRTRVVFIANPNNPTGTWRSAESLERFVKEIPERVIVVVDEAYCDYVEAHGYPDCVRWIERYPNLVVTRTFSKAHGLAGLRVGYGVSVPAIAELLNRVRQPFNVNSVALAAARASLGDSAHVDRARKVNRAGLSQLAAGFERLGLEFIPSVGNFIAVDVGRPGIEVFQQLLRRGAIVRPIESYGMPRHLRVSVGLEHENARLLDALGAVLAR